MASKSGKSEDISKTPFGYLFNHLFLPPKLPVADDSSQKNEAALLEFVQRSLKRFLSVHHDEESVKAGISILRSLRTSRDSQGYLKDVAVRDILKDLTSKGTAFLPCLCDTRKADQSFTVTVAALHITEQNAGVFISRNSDSTSVCFEVFELLPINEAAMSVRGRLVRYFPATAVEVTMDDFASEDFQVVMAKTLAKMSHQPVRETKQVMGKDRHEKDEVRETSDPMIVTQLLASILRGCGKEVAVDRVCKNTRDEITGQNSRSPWRRSSTWLLIRVALQLAMARVSAAGKNTYKEFMVFLMAQVLHSANEQQKIPSETLQTMSNKVSRRLCKLQKPSHGLWLNNIHDVVSKTSEVLHERWRCIIEKAEPPLSLSELSKFKIEDNVAFSLRHMETFIKAIAQRKSGITESKFRPTSEHDPLPQIQLPSVVKDWRQDDIPFKLLAIERWVAENLQTWIDHHMRKTDNPVQALRHLLEAYHSRAAKYYTESPEGASRMVLTTSELWCAADIAAIQQLPLLADYSPQIPVILWQALLLGSLDDMKRLRRLEIYLQKRVKTSEKADRPSVFSSFGSPGSFAVQFFSKSTRHQQIKSEIEAEAATKRQEKREEFREAKAEYIRLMQKHAESECDVTTKRDGGSVVYIHPSSCRRCGFESKANALAVYVHEWPLPQNDLEAQAAVFEMDAPVAFSEWRDLTAYFIHDVLLCQLNDPLTPRTTYFLKSYQPLKPWYATKRNYRINLTSEAKPNSVINRRAVRVAEAIESDVCVSSGTVYQYYDQVLNSFTSDPRLTDGLSQLCTFTLPKKAHALSHFLHRSWTKPDGQTPNEVIVSQFQWPEWMPLSEFRALTGMAYGHKLQWMNILMELAMPRIDFKRPETAVFLLQLSLQAGPESSSVARSSHSRPCDELFGRRILESLYDSVSRVQENWESYTALWSFTFLSARLLSLVSKELSQDFMDLLKQCRKISYTWLKALLERAEDTSDDSQRKEFLKAASNIALICIDSFNVDDSFLHQILASPQQAAIMVECSIVVHEYLALKADDDQMVQDILLGRWRQTMHRARPIMAEQIARDSSFLSDAVAERWRYFQPTSSWSPSTGTHSWYETTMEHVRMHLNILTGELLANNLPLSRLPKDYETHQDYMRIFGNLIHNVMPSTVAGMVFCTTQLVHNYTVHFGSESKGLIFRLENGKSCYDYIPHRLLVGLLPDDLVDDYAHWYNNETGAVQFCPLSDPFPAQYNRWCLKKLDGLWKLCGEEGVFLLPPSSGLSKYIANVLAGLEDPLRLHMVYDTNRKLLDIKIPKLELGFSLDQGDWVIRSHQFKEMQIDENQSLGTLVGLKSKLILRSMENPPSRLILIPEGDVEIKKKNNGIAYDHVSASVRHRTARRVQSYHIDNLLGRFVSETKLESKLYLAYLHALTSFCLPDPFIGRRGTEEALDILCSASVRTPTVLSTTSCRLLNLIAGLAPSRHYHPGHLKVMQAVTWSSELPVSAQDDRFFSAVNEIFQRSSEIEFLYPNAAPQPDRELHTNIDLAQRATSRNPGQHIFGFRTEDYLASPDKVYQSRDNTKSEREVRATAMAEQAFHSVQGVMDPVAGGLALRLYKVMAMGKTVNSRGAPPKRDMEYDSMWLERPSYYLSSYWPRLHHAFHENPQWLNKMELSVWIASVAYSAEHDQQITQALLLMALSPSVAAAPLPSNEVRDLTNGYTLQPDTLEAAAASRTVKFKQGPEGKSGSRAAKGDGKDADQLQREYERNKKQAINIFKDRMARQWPCQVPKKPSDYHMEAYIDVDRATKAVLTPWRMWWANKGFKEYLEGFVAALKNIPLKTASIGRTFVPRELPTKTSYKGFVSTSDLFRHEAPDTGKSPELSIQLPVVKVRVERPERNRLGEIIDFLDSQACYQHERRYLDELRHSMSSLKDLSQNGLVRDVSTAILPDHLLQCESRYQDLYRSLCSAIQPFLKSPEPHSPEDMVETTLSIAGYQPRVSPLFFLQQLRRSNWSKLPPSWKNAIIHYGVADLKGILLTCFGS
jgi:predicted Zn-ribbon and HTH transcriptional regulator